MFFISSFCTRMSGVVGSQIPDYRKCELIAGSLNTWYRILVRRRRFSTFPAGSTSESPVTMNIPQFYSIFTPELKKLASVFQKHGYELRIVGGAVRDLLDGKKPIDVDFATTATPDQMIHMCHIENIRILHKRGEKHGTIATRVDDKENFEITTLRTDVTTDGRHAQVEFTTDWRVDAARRDLTINSMYLDLDGRLYDYFNGYEDLKKRRVVFVGNARARIQEDYLRILRYFRFFGRIVKDPNTHDEDTLAAIHATASGLERISGERIWSELSRILSGPFVLEVVQKMLHVGLAPYMGLGETDKLNIPCFARMCQLNNEYAFKPISYIAVLLSDENDVLRFNARVKLSRYEQDLALFLVHHKSDDLSTPSADRFRLFLRVMVLTRIPAERMREYIIELLHFNDERALLAQFEPYRVPSFRIDNTMLKRVGIKRKEERDYIIDKLKDAWVTSDFQLTVDDLLKRIPDIVLEFASNKT